LPVDADCALRCERRNLLFSTSSVSSASLWFIAKAMFQQWLLFGSPARISHRPAYLQRFCSACFPHRWDESFFPI